jgi:cupin 2 domain-containing protein
MIANIFSGLPQMLQEERFDTLAGSDAVRIERIVSQGQATPEGEWYDQERDEWVLLLAGSADLLFEGEATLRHLAAGDYLLIPAHCRHRVAWTDPERQTVWLGVHYPGSSLR